MVEIVSIHFDDLSEKAIPGCSVFSFSSNDGKHWRTRDLRIKEIAYPQEWVTAPEGVRDLSVGQRSLHAVAMDGFIALNCYINKDYGVLLIHPNYRYQFVPIVEPDGYFIFAMEFSSDARTLILLYRSKTWNENKPETTKADCFVTQFIHWDNRGKATLDTVPGWFAWAGTRIAILVDKSGKVFTCDLAARHRGNHNPAEIRIAALLEERNSQRVLLPKAYRVFGKDLPSLMYGVTEKMYEFSPDLQLMFEMQTHQLGPPEGGDPWPDWGNDFVRDTVIGHQRGILWTMIRGSHDPPIGFQFTDNHGSFRFLKPGPVRLGTRQRGRELSTGMGEWKPKNEGLMSYPAGYFEGNIHHNRVRYIPSPKPFLRQLGTNPLPGDIIMRYSLGNTVLLMKQKVKQQW